MTVKQFLFTTMKTPKGEKDFWPPIGDLLMIIVGNLMVFLLPPNDKWGGFVTTAIFGFVFIAEVFVYKRQNLRTDEQNRKVGKHE